MKYKNKSPTEVEAERESSTKEGMVSGRYETNDNQLKMKHCRANKVKERSPRKKNEFL